MHFPEFRGDKDVKMKYYLKATIKESIERAKKLKSKIPNNLNVHFQKLAETSQNKIDAIINDLQFILTDARYQMDANQTFRLQKLKLFIRILDIMENVVVAAVSRYHEDDIRVNVMVQNICREVNYPLIPPTVTCLSQKYYRIFNGFNLLCVPLLECDFLLHLPDLYHELGHPLIEAENNPKNQPFKESMGSFYDTVKQYYEAKKTDDEINNQSKVAPYYEKWKRYWHNWTIEFYCDLFGVCTVGPAYGWAHLHLTAKTGHNPYDVEKVAKDSSHPNDESRMIVICAALELLGYKEEKKRILAKWNALKRILSSKTDVYFSFAYPNELLEMCAVMGLEAVKSIGCTLANRENQGKLFITLNTAWEKFWEDEQAYFAWESEVIANFR